MPTTQPVVIPLPENVQEAVNLAYARTSALKEQEDESRRSKTKLDKEIGHLSLEKETLEGLKVIAQADYDRVAKSLKELRSEFNSLTESVSLAKEELKTAVQGKTEAKEATEKEVTRRNEVINDISQRTESIVSRETAHEEAVKAFEAKKQAFVELLKNF
jgi:hypothetical protein